MKESSYLTQMNEIVGTVRRADETVLNNNDAV